MINGFHINIYFFLCGIFFFFCYYINIKILESLSLLPILLTLLSQSIYYFCLTFKIFLSHIYKLYYYYMEKLSKKKNREISGKKKIPKHIYKRLYN